MQFFVKTVGHYASYIKREANGQGHFQERAFYKALPSKANRRFVKKFVKTQLFSLFIQEAEKSKNPPAGIQLQCPFNLSLEGVTASKLGVALQ